MRAIRSCLYCRQPFDADVSEEGDGQEVCGPCDGAFNGWLSKRLDEVTEDLTAAALNWCENARRLSETVLATIDSLDVA